LTTKYEIEKVTDWKDKRFSFFADPQERKTESRTTFGTLPFADTQANASQKSKSQILPTRNHF